MKEFDVYKRLVNKLPVYSHALNEFRDILHELPDDYLTEEEIKLVEDAIDRGDIKDITPRYIVMLTELKDSGVDTSALFKYIEPKDGDDKFTEVVGAYIKYVVIPRLGKEHVVAAESVKESDGDVEAAKKVLKYSEKGAKVLGVDDLEGVKMQKKKARVTLKKAGMSAEEIKSEELEEGLAQVRKKYGDKVPKNVWPRLEMVDPTPTKKYMDWMVRQYLAQPDRLDHLVDVMRLFNRQVMSQQRQGEETDILRYKTLAELDTSVEEVIQRQEAQEPERREKDFKRKLYKGKEGLAAAQQEVLDSGDANIKFDDDNVMVVEILTHKAAQAFRNLEDEDDTKSWCTTRQHPQYWNNYDGQGQKFYHVIIKSIDPIHPRYAITVTGSEDNPTRHVYDNNDQPVDYEKFRSMLDRLMGE